MAKKKASLTDIPKDPLAELKKATERRKAETPMVQPEEPKTTPVKSEKKPERTAPTGKKEPTKNLNTRVPVSTIKEIKKYCAEHDMSIQEFVNQAIIKRLVS